MRLIFGRIILFAGLFFYADGFAQDMKPPVSSEKILNEGNALYGKEKYKEAIVEYMKVPHGDSNYVNALKNLSLAYLADSNFAEALQYAKKGLKLFPEKKPEWYNVIANSLDKSGKTNEALAYYDSIILKYNSQGIAWYNKGITYYNKKQYAEAKKCFFESLIINPYYPASHYFLGNIAYEEGNLAPAIMSFATVLMINPESNYGSSAIRLLSDISKATDDVMKKANAKKPSNTDDYDVIQEILISKIALDKQYKNKTDLEDVIVRQMQVMLEKLAYQKNDKGFWMQYYVPLFEQLYKEGQFEPLVYYMFSSVDIKDIQSYVKKNKKKFEVVAVYITNYFNALRETRELQYLNRKDVQVKYLYTNNLPAGKGKITGEGKNAMLVGDWEFFHDNGQLKSKGKLNDKQEKEGEWLYYYANGQPKEKTSFVNNKPEGKSFTYYDNGALFSEDNYKNGETEGSYKEWYFNGLLKKDELYNAGKKHGIQKGYTQYGTLDYVKQFKEGKEDGVSTYYYLNGNVTSKANVVNDKFVKEFKRNYLDGILKLEGSFEDGKRIGDWKDYYNNGVLKSVAKYIAGDMHGEYVEYYDNGKPMVKSNYVKDKLEGKYEDFDVDGKIFSESYYEKGRLRELKFFGKDGQVISNTTTRTGAANLIFFDPFGNKTSEGFYTKEGLRNGKFTYYFRNGKISSVYNYKEGLMHGEATTYYIDGTVSGKKNYKDDEEHGYKILYHENGKVKQEGYLTNDNLDGVQLYFNKLGNLTAKLFYVNGTREGDAHYHNEGGKKNIDETYSSGWLIELTKYDSTGKDLSNVDLHAGKAEYSLKDNNGKNYIHGTYTHFYLNGEHKFVYPDGSTNISRFYKNGKSDSIYKRYYYGGKLDAEGSYKMDELHGKWTYYWENGKLYYTETYNNGRLNGVTKLFREDGSPERDMPYKEGEIDGAYKFYGENGLLAVQLNFREDKLISYTYEGKDGNMVADIPVKNGTAKVVAYYKNGTQSAEMNYENDDVNGVYRIFFSNGKPYIDGMRLLGYDHGARKIYYANGQLKEDRNYYYGQRHGVVKAYHENGQLKAEENWYYGDLHDSGKYFDATGKLSQTRIYYHGSLQSVK